MTASTPDDSRPSSAAPFAGLEVATVRSDNLRASIRVSGPVLASTAPLLTSVLRTHVAAGRRYLRVDLAAAHVVDPEVIEVLVDARRSLSDVGGILVFENAGPRIVDAVRRATLFVRVSA